MFIFKFHTAADIKLKKKCYTTVNNSTDAEKICISDKPVNFNIVVIHLFQSRNCPFTMCRTHWRVILDSIDTQARCLYLFFQTNSCDENQSILCVSGGAGLPFQKWARA